MTVWNGKFNLLKFSNAQPHNKTILCNYIIKIQSTFYIARKFGLNTPFK